MPANTVNFERWRFDGPKTWTALEKILADLSPQSVEALGLIFETAQAKAREKEPGYDLKQALFGNLGDDLIVYEKPPRGQTPAEPGSPPSIALLGSPNPEQLAAAFQALLVILPSADAATEREFLGRKIRSVPLPASLPLPLAESSAWAARPASLHYAASRDYVALSTDASLLEEYLRSNETQGKALREIPGLAEAAQKVTGPGTAFFGYENRLETTRAAFEAFRADPAPSTQGRAGSFWLALLGMAAPQQSVRAWLDVSLLPPFARVGKYFHFAVSGASASVDGLTYKVFFPVPPAMGH